MTRLEKLRIVCNVITVACLVYICTASAAVKDTLVSHKAQNPGIVDTFVSLKAQPPALTPKSIPVKKSPEKQPLLTQRSRVPANEAKYRSYLIREARRQAGMDAPISMWAGQIHQESGWNKDAKSAFASGLTQFTPDTEKWIISMFPDLGTEGVKNPEWAIRGLIRYDLYLKTKVKAKTECDDWAKALSGYNGGLGWVYRDEKLAASKGKDPGLWWGNVELYSPRAPQFVKENRDYPAKILLKHQPLYLSTGWYGDSTVCGEKL